MLPQGKKQITHSLKSQQIYMKKYFLGLAVAALSLGLASCDKKDEPKNPQQGQVKTVVIDASDYTKYVYFSFEEGKVVSTTAWDDEAHKSQTNWDLGLHRYDFRTNSGLSGKGQGGAVETSSENINDKITIPAADQFEVDKSQRQLVEFSHGADGARTRYEDISANLVLTTTQQITMQDGRPVYKIIKKGAITLDMGGHGSGGGPSTTLSSKVYLVRTASGKFAKVKVTGYSTPVKGKDGSVKPVSGHITLQYVYPVQ